MSYNRPTSVEHVELRYPCSMCGQGPGDWCLKRFGGRAPYLHSARYNEALKLRRLPLTGGES